jgi:glycosyltransferase involved in cell wall biosynthesis
MPFSIRRASGDLPRCDAVRLCLPAWWAMAAARASLVVVGTQGLPLAFSQTAAGPLVSIQKVAVTELKQDWICCQIGAREHYAISRALARANSLARLITDSWVTPTWLLGRITSQRSQGSSRFHEELSDAPVTAFNLPLMQFELLARARRLRGWDKVIARNEWFQGKTLQWLHRNAEKLKAETLTALPISALRTSHSAPVIFSYSYAARDILGFAKTRGWKTILGQIDPGPVEEEIVRAEHEAYPEFLSDWTPAPSKYWQSWREECELADSIIVNSEWSRKALELAGIDREKLLVVPLAYEQNRANQPRRDSYPDRFTVDRPLRVLFLGQINLRKGVAELLEAAQALQNEPIEFWMVGPLECRLPGRVRALKNVRWFGRVAHADAQNYYCRADLFILPTLSDGFALTQLEAQAYGLPVIASRRCGEVVEDGINGIVLDEPTPDAIAAALQFCLGHPDRLASFSAASCVKDRFSIDALGHNLLSIGSVP